MATGPLPQPDPVTRPYWESVKAHAMRIQRCGDCARYVFYPRALCPICGGASLEWHPVCGRGALYSFTVVHRAPTPELQVEAPYVVALADLEEGVRLMARLTGFDADPEHIQIGTPLALDYDDVDAGVTLPRFRPA
jgi:uncharacterized protein